MIATVAEEALKGPSFDSADLELQSIWRRVQADDESAFAELVERYDSLLGVVIRLRMGVDTRRMWDTVDFKQVVWSCLYRQRHQQSFENRNGFMKYLLSIARNQVVSASRKLELPVDSNGSALEASSFDPTPSEIVSHQETLERLHSVDRSAQLMVEQRQQGWSFRGIASYFGLNERTVRRRFSHLREKLFGQ